MLNYFLIFIVFFLQSTFTSCQLLISFFCFNGEAISFYHMSYLKDTVDYIFLIESNQTHSGMSKEFYYVDKYKDIIESINSTGKLMIEKITFPDSLKSAWHREKYQRNIAKDVITNHRMSQVVTDQ